MPDYKKLYHKTFNALTDAERLLQQATAIIQTAQRECEEIYIESDNTPISLRDTNGAGMPELAEEGTPRTTISGS